MKKDKVEELFEKIVKENPTADLQTIALKLQQECNKTKNLILVILFLFVFSGASAQTIRTELKPTINSLEYEFDIQKYFDGKVVRGEMKGDVYSSITGTIENLKVNRNYIERVCQKYEDVFFTIREETIISNCNAFIHFKKKDGKMKFHNGFVECIESN